MSKLENKVELLLYNAKIKYIREKQIKDFRNNLMRFDFYIPEQKIAIEVQGQQHYQFTRNFYHSYSEFTAAQERDRLKITYCLAHGIKLYCIPYWFVPQLQCAAGLFKNEFVATSKFHNDTVWQQKI